MAYGGARRGSALLHELSRAEAKIGTLEDFIRERERQLQVAVSRLQRGEAGERRRSQLLRGRRTGLVDDGLIRMRQVQDADITPGT